MRVMGSPPPAEIDLPGGLPRWLATFVREALHETETLRDNGAHQADTARATLIQKLLTTATSWLDSEIDVSEAARTTGVCEETIRRAVRGGIVPDRRPNPRSRHRIRRGDLEKLAATHPKPYDAHADAQDIARRRRQFP